MSTFKIKKGDTVKVIAGKDKDKEGKVFDLKGDTVIVSVGYKPAPLTGTAKHVHLVGDANGVGDLRTVIWRAWDICMKL